MQSVLLQGELKTAMGTAFVDGGGAAVATTGAVVKHRML